MTPLSKSYRDRFDDADPFKIDGVYCKLIPLTKGQYAIVDASDYASLTERAWQAAWSPYTRSFYAIRTVVVEGKKTSVKMHRQILNLEVGKEQVDHKNTCTLDNRRDNLRIASASQNQMNSRISRINTSGYRGVTLDRRTGRWIAVINRNRMRTHLGTFDDPLDAYNAYRRAALDHGKEYARL